RLREDLWQLLLLNSRCPHLLDGDLRAMLGSTRIGAERIAALVADLGVAQGRRYLAAILEHAERMMRAELARLPDGRWQGEDGSDTDCFDAVEVRVRVTVRIEGDAILFDFAGTDPQTRGFKNSSLANTCSSVYMALGAFLDADLPRNEGACRAVTIRAPEGSVVNARFPAAMTMNTVYPAGEIVHACWQALAQVDPDRACAGWGKVAYCITSGPDRQGQPYVMYHWHGSSGGGAVRGRDGFNTIGQLTTLGGMSLPDVEVFEQLYPVAIRRQEFRCDGGGAGRFRGGTGVTYEADILEPAQFAFRGEGIRRPSGFGTVGGGTGAVGSMSLAPAAGPPVEAPQYGVRPLPPLRLAIASPGGGGWGDPRRRDPAAVLRDVADGVVSPEAARSVYGVALTADGAAVDHAATRRLRGAAAGPAASA
ncbi:hydantoinase B/oxoprolinase family protein, partial [Marinibaculum pumilum]